MTADDEIRRPPGVEAELRIAQVEAAMQAPPAIAEPAEAPWRMIRDKLAALCALRDPAREVEGWREIIAGRPLAWWLMWHTVHRPGLAAAMRDGFPLHGHEVGAHMVSLASKHGGMPHQETRDPWTRYTFPDGTIYAFERAPRESGPWSAERDAWRQLQEVPVMPGDPDSALASRGPIATTEERIQETCPRHEAASAICGCPTSAETLGVRDSDLPF